MCSEVIWFTDLGRKNKVLLGKWMERFYANITSLWKTVVCLKVGWDLELCVLDKMGKITASKSSCVWRDIHGVSLEEGMSDIIGSSSWQWCLGNGKKNQVLGRRLAERLVSK